MEKEGNYFPPRMRYAQESDGYFHDLNYNQPVCWLEDCSSTGNQRVCDKSSVGKIISAAYGYV